MTQTVLNGRPSRGRFLESIGPCLDPVRALGSARPIALPSLVQGVSDGIRTRDRRDHNPELYQLSYAHQALRI
jgi:hypothetical protein